MNHPQCACAIAMVRPASFGYNEETARNNFFQNRNSSGDLQQLALNEFENMVTLLESKGIDVLILEDTADPPKPDAIFPNNWFSCNNKQLSIFPMEAHSRRLEKRNELIEQIQQKTGINKLNDLSAHEANNVFLEGTGSIVFDHANRLAYACESSRTNHNLFEDYCRSINYFPIIFNAKDENNRPIYHTNVMMCVGDRFAVICLEAITDKIDRQKVEHELLSTGHEIIEISFDQMNCLAGNMLELCNGYGDHFLVMSSSAYASLHSNQLAALQNYSELLAINVGVIESAAGGSVRCMMAELFY